MVPTINGIGCLSFDLFYGKLIMNIKHIQTEKFKGIAIQLPNKVYHFKLNYHTISKMWTLYDSRNKKWEFTIPTLLTNKGHVMYHMIGKAHELSEEQCAEIVPLQEWCHYFDYQLSRGHLQNYCDTAKESFNSYLNSIECYSTNPHIKPDDEKYAPITDEDKDSLFLHDWMVWTKAELNTGTWIILETIEK